MLSIPVRAIFIAALLVSVAGCASRSRVHLNDPARSSLATDVATFDDRKIPYEMQEGDGLRVAYSLTFVPQFAGDLHGYRLTLMFQNRGDQQRRIAPIVTLQDGAGFVIAPTTHEAMVALGAAMAGTPAPAIPVTASSPTYYHSGTVRDMTTGRSASYSGYSAPASSPAAGFASGFASGIAQGAALGAIAERREGRELMQWTSAFWLKSNYDLPPGAAAAGALFFPSPKLGPLPLRLAVDIDGERFDFVTVAVRE